MANSDSSVRWQRIKSHLAFASLALVGLLLFFGVVGAAVWRAYTGEQYPPTPTIPAGVEPSYAYVSAVSGVAESQMPGLELSLPLAPGQTIAAGPGALVRVGENGWLRLGFVNGATLFLDAATEVELRQIADASGALTETIVRLNYGRLLADAGPDSDLLMVLTGPTEARAQGTEALMGVEYEEDLQRFSLHCLIGDCLLQSRSGEEQELETGESSWVQGFSAPFAVRVAAYERFQSLGDPGLVPTATPTEQNVTATPSATAERPSPTAVTLEATPVLPTFTPRPSATPTRWTATSTMAPTTETTTATPPSTLTREAVPTNTATLTATITSTTTTTTPTTAATPTVPATQIVTATPTATATGTPGAQQTATPTAQQATATAPPGTVAGELPQAVVTNADWLNIREGPGTEYEILTAAARDSVLQLTGFRDEDTTWVSVRQPDDGLEGWAHSFYLETDYPLSELQLWEGATPTPQPTVSNDE